MMTPYVCAFRGRRDSYQVPVALTEGGLLDRFRPRSGTLSLDILEQVHRQYLSASITSVIERGASLDGSRMYQALRIVQTPHYLVIVNEMVHDVRIVRMATQHIVPTIRPWLGDSIGRWDGDTLVVETTNFTDKTDFSGSSENLRVTERYTLASPDVLRYEFTIDDAASFTRPWSGMLWMTRTDTPIYEYACHEANYAMIDILRGARAAEAHNDRR